MADQQNAPRDEAPRGEESGNNSKSSLFKRLFNFDVFMSRRILATLLVLSMLGHVAYVIVDRQELKKPKSTTREVTLGDFSFDNHTSTEGSIRRVDFRLHVDLLAGTDDVARRRLDLRQSMVQQNVEQLLRRARAVDFTDPVLAELKRQLQETINETISLRGVADIIITDLAIQRAGVEEPKASVAAHRQKKTDGSPSG